MKVNMERLTNSIQCFDTYILEYAYTQKLQIDQFLPISLTNIYTKDQFEAYMCILWKFVCLQSSTSIFSSLTSIIISFTVILILETMRS